ncbi:MAG: hypothetical protein WC565_09405 [Parcubacteria group bacterium]
MKSPTHVGPLPLPIRGIAATLETGTVTVNGRLEANATWEWDVVSDWHDKQGFEKSKTENHRIVSLVGSFSTDKEVTIPAEPCKVSFSVRNTRLIAKIAVSPTSDQHKLDIRLTP